MSTRRQVGRHMAKSKDKLERRTRKGRLADKGGSQYGSSDDESCDTMSMLSQDSTLHRGSQESEPAEEEAVCDESFDDKLKMFLDSALESKSSQRRTAYLQSLTRCLISNYCPEFLADRPATLSDLVEKSLRKGKEEEQIAAATLISVVALQYGASPEGASIQQSLKRIFVQLLMNESISARVRERVAYALALTTYMAEGDPYNISEVMEILKAIYSNSCPDINGKSPAVTPAESALHQTALQSWGLLLTVTEECAHSLVDKTLATVTALLHSSEMEMKIAAGEVLAAMYEIARERDNEFVGDDLEELCEVLHMLATDSQKFRGKKERRVQRASFRDIEKAIRDGDKPDFDVRFNGMERVQVRNWETKRTYDSVCSLLGSGMNHHLQFNPQVRDLFGLGSPVLVTNMNLGAPKLERMQYNQMDKARTKRLAKCRDKRLDIM